MRLLNATTRKFEDFVGDVPEYAILSHTWREDEVSFKDINDNPRVEFMKGYQKIRFTCDQALEDGLNFVWCDTCCIDKSSSAELSEAINSMWTYYRQSNVCYAHIDDCSITERREVLSDCNRWFGRGWTLQELIAPPHLVFYDAAWNRLGSRNGRLLHQIHLVTKVPEEILLGDFLERRLSRCSIAQRMSWAASRKTSRIEDGAYCLLGLFDVNMPMLYGEGHKAFRRLQEEIIKTSTDHSILAGDVGTGGMLFAMGASEFFGCGNIDACSPEVPMESYSMTNRGLMMTLLVFQEHAINGTTYLDVVLNCSQRGETFIRRLQQLTRRLVPANLPLEYTVLPGPPRPQRLSRVKRLRLKARKIVIVPRSLPATISTVPGHKRLISPSVGTDAALEQYKHSSMMPPERFITGYDGQDRATWPSQNTRPEEEPYLNVDNFIYNDMEPLKRSTGRSSDF